ncbi:CrcB family protein [Sporosarcina sp. 179-K 3D1 HS]|uniref:fluoride efflux transporter FluC n=1 Tax=Sporosarcina sp. 179-K 3D1 HS TaxID=3232169 RepID=UPI0039A2AB6C
MRSWVWVGLAGMAGASCRFLFGRLVVMDVEFPVATFLVNMIGTFLLCYLVAGALPRWTTRKELQDAITTGFLGSFTTFSAFGMEVVLLVEQGRVAIAALYVAASLIGGMAVGAAGFYAGGRRRGHI